MAEGRNFRLKKDESAEARNLRQEVSARSMHLNWFSPITFEVVLSLLSEQQRALPLRMLDVGCGNGEFARRFLTVVPQGTTVCIDAAPSHVENTRQRLESFGARTRVLEDVLENAANWESLGNFDLITIANVFHFIGDEDLDGILRGICARLNVGGMLVATQFIALPPNLKKLYSRGHAEFQKLTHETFQPSGRELAELKALEEKLKVLRESGQSMGFDTTNVMHTRTRLMESMRAAGFSTVDELGKFFDLLMILAVREQ